MAFKNETEHSHLESIKTGVLLVNLGTPDSCETADVRRYLKEFLWDPRVVEVPRLAWWFALNLVILNTRPKRSAAAYRKIWTDAGSPLLVISRQQEVALKKQLQQMYGDNVTVALAMRYGSPSIADGLEDLRQQGVRKILVLPLYPQYSASTMASTFDAIADELKSWRWIPELRFINHYHDDSGYIMALAESIRAYQSENGEPDRLILSFHGIPREYLEKGDPYYCECQKTARLLVDELKLSEDQWQLTFQSRLGPKEWLKPYTDETLRQLPDQGVKHVQVVCPGFSADCLETLEEIAMENRDVFHEAGGDKYDYIPCLNDSPEHIIMLSDLVQKHVQGWLTDAEDPDEKTLRQQRYEDKRKFLGL